ncbi:MAG: cation diffusion facilitator family transporter [Betaproteobacteria bacterium]|nr:cation diffusion facilitator family transporter [Betaproteobacteria bacterium]
MHAHPHDHTHDHGHPHHHGTPGGAHAQATRAFLVGILLNGGFVVLEASFGVFSHSLALIADAGHNLSDVLALALGWGAAALAMRPPSPQFSYGLRSSSILAALANALILLLVTGAIGWAALLRLGAPQPVAGATMIGVAAIGIVINGATALMFAAGRRTDLNIRAAFMHMASDALIALGVVLTGVAIRLTGWMLLDPIVSLAISALIVWSTWGVLREAANLALHGVPAGIDIEAIRDYLAHVPGVAEVHDLHVWGMSTTETALTAHLVIPCGHPNDTFISELAQALRERFSIGHTTVQIERGDGAAPCVLAPDHVV